ncbi:MAG TPA: acyl--CoA ligase [Gemmatimonadaceae bacterium]|jgi:acyl-CoA synthetase (AMP-forming)/AMP-acid ligase II|nr:acyl--CoA ligase [Gemmatimonadaceae bacterium]
MSAGTISDFLEAGADDAPALNSPGGTPLNYRGLRALVADIAASLASQGIGPNDRVGIVLDNGPEMAAAFLAVGSAATAAPLNPTYRADEFEFYLTDLRAKLLVVAAGKDSPAVGVAEKLGIPIARLIAHPERGAGTFTLQYEGSGGTPQSVRPASPDDIALVLHTSGTTSRPKIVPLAHKNIAASASNIRKTLGLTANDRGLVIMPLFHIHGLIAALSAPLSAGGECCCSPGFNALKFFGWLDEVKPTWYTGVPTMHQAILLRAAGNQEIIKNHRLRFIRSSSSALPPTVIAELERVFGVPVVEAYGMTEAAHQMASNPLTGPRKAGTVGPSGGPEIRIVDETGTTVPRGQTGEIVIKGPNVMSAYENNPKANADAFYDGWFRTGDQGVMDDDGYVSITGRLKEIINRGGEKISPREVDEIIMDHPAVHQCVTFAMPHDMLGEEVAAAIVLRQGVAATDKELREFASARLAPYKVPKKILILDQIPVGATGKLQRIGLAQKLGLA